MASRVRSHTDTLAIASCHTCVGHHHNVCYDGTHSACGTSRFSIYTVACETCAVAARDSTYKRALAEAARTAQQKYPIIVIRGTELTVMAE